MSTTVKTGWLEDSNGDKFAPKTLTSQVQMRDGTLIEDKIQSDINNIKKEIPTKISDLTDDTTHRTVTDTEKAAWNAKSNFSGDYNDLLNAPNIVQDNSGNLIITDANGNIFRSNGNGFETINLTVQSITINGKTIQEMIKEYVDETILGGEW